MKRNDQPIQQPDLRKHAEQSADCHPNLDQVLLPQPVVSLLPRLRFGVPVQRYQVLAEPSVDTPHAFLLAVELPEKIPVKSEDQGAAHYQSRNRQHVRPPLLPLDSPHSNAVESSYTMKENALGTHKVGIRDS
jgi:hypothetical protein